MKLFIIFGLVTILAVSQINSQYEGSSLQLYYPQAGIPYAQPKVNRDVSYPQSRTIIPLFLNPFSFLSQKPSLISNPVKQNQITSLQSQITALQNQVKALQEQIRVLQCLGNRSDVCVIDGLYYTFPRVKTTYTRALTACPGAMLPEPNAATLADDNFIAKIKKCFDDAAVQIDSFWIGATVMETSTGSGVYNGRYNSGSGFIPTTNRWASPLTSTNLNNAVYAELVQPLWKLNSENPSLMTPRFVVCQASLAALCPNPTG